ncbi:MAG: hypothetical protein PUP93_32810 [Rhizonema sp. NSF051]|nr:hypothetical protein [Rhizonema sp. NSF051]
MMSYLQHRVIFNFASRVFQRNATRFPLGDKVSNVEIAITGDESIQADKELSKNNLPLLKS